VDISSSFFGQTKSSPPRETFAYFDGAGCYAFRYKKWKLFIRDEHSSGTNAQVVKTGPVSAGALFNLDDDQAETTDVSSEYPEIHARLKKMADQFVEEFEKNRRNPGRMD